MILGNHAEAFPKIGDGLQSNYPGGSIVIVIRLARALCWLPDAWDNSVVDNVAAPPPDCLPIEGGEPGPCFGLASSHSDHSRYKIPRCSGHARCMGPGRATQACEAPLGDALHAGVRTALRARGSRPRPTIALHALLAQRI